MMVANRVSEKPEGVVLRGYSGIVVTGRYK